MNKGPEGMAENTSAEVGKETEKKLPEVNSEESPEAKITNTLGEIDHVDREIFDAQKSIAETESKLVSLREGMGASLSNETSPAAEFQNERIEQLKKQKGELRYQKERWIEENGRDNLPEGIAMESEGDVREARGASFKQEKELSEQMQKEELEFRKKWVKEWEEETIKNFEQAMRGDWMAGDAVNIDLAVQLMKLRVPTVMEKETEDFVTGKDNEGPLSPIWLKWSASSLADKMLGKQNLIRSLEITFDGGSQKLAEDRELKKEEKDGSLAGDAKSEVAGKA